MTRSEPRWSVTSRAAALVVSCVLSLAALEGVVRRFLPVPVAEIGTDLARLSDNPALLYELNPEHPDHNESGFRGEDRSRGKPEGTQRVAVLGDSIAYGLGLENEETISWHLESLLNGAAEGGPQARYEVLNFGVPGYTIIQEAEQSRALALAFDPDVAVLIVCLNDWEAFTFQFEVLLAARDGSERRFLSWLYDPGSSGVRRLLFRSHVVRRLVYLFSTWTTPPASGSSYEDPDGMRVATSSSFGEYYDGRAFYGEHFRRLAGDLAERGIPLVVLLSPWEREGGGGGYAERLEELDTLCSSPSCRLVDFLRVLRDALPHRDRVFPNEFYMEDRVHLTNEGNRLAAQALAPHVRSLLRRGVAER